MYILWYLHRFIRLVGTFQITYIIILELGKSHNFVRVPVEKANIRNIYVYIYVYFVNEYLLSPGF